MEVLSVTLKNFKVHRDRYYEFRPGANAICGENGSGKTTILEAIAWVLFDHSEYTRSELISVGAKSAQATVRFVSNLDHRVYEVCRCTHRGYEVYDPQLHCKLELRKLEDVRCWLCEHLGVGVDTELAKLFAETIGIPQGTFTVDFLKRPGDRKKVFDPILKVEAYKQAYDDSRDLETYARTQVEQLEQGLLTYDQQLKGWADLKQHHADLAASLSQDQGRIAQLADQLAQLQAELKVLNAQAQALQVLEKQIQHLQTQLASKQEMLQLLEHNWQNAEQAVQICRQHRPGFQAYEQAQATLKTLSQQQKQRQQLLQGRDRLQIQLRDLQVQQSQIQGQLATLANMRQKRQDWQKLVPQQHQLQQEQATCEQTLQTFMSDRRQYQRLHQQHQHYQQRSDALSQTIDQLLTLQPQVQAIPDLDLQRQQIQERLGRGQAAQALIQELQQFMAQTAPEQQRYLQKMTQAQDLIHSLSIPPPQQTQLLQILEQGTTLANQIFEHLQTAFADWADPQLISQLEQQLQQLNSQLQTAKTVEQQWLTLEAKQQQHSTLAQEMSTLEQECDRLQASFQQEPQLQEQLSVLETQLSALNDPQGQIRVLDQQLQGAAQLETKIASFDQQGQNLQQSLDQIETQLQAFADLEALVDAQHQIQQEYQTVYQLYLRHRNQANTFKELDQQRREAIASQAHLQQQLTEVQTAWQQQSENHDPACLALMMQTYEQLQREQDQLQGGLAPQQTQLESLAQQLQTQEGIAQKRDQALVDLATKQQVLQFIADARNIYKQSGSRITKFYLTEISWEADRLYRELLNRPDVALQWTEDYEIQVQEQGHWRSFRSLSGGEQMCAALAVRLALLKVLVDINIAFFDEPTTNMDEPRRRQLATALGHLKSFHQLFVISHDDTFESVTENIIR
ncbi:MAG: SMC family ATPase, partial [Acaryochloris sp. SU_5_25]|nr:SMC family ATPase [Acaryochloris sp. SU_5_25]